MFLASVYRCAVLRSVGGTVFERGSGGADFEERGQVHFGRMGSGSLRGSPQVNLTSITGNPMLDAWAVGPGAYAAIRGREQQVIDFFGGVGNPKVGNSIRGVAKMNPAGRGFWNRSNATFGPLSPFTGVFSYEEYGC